MVFFVEPSNKILVAGNPVVAEFKDGSSGAIVPGDLCYISSASHTIDEGGAATGSQDLAIGIVGYEQAHDKYKPTNTATAYDDGSFVPVILLGSGCVVRARVAAGVVAGDALTGSGTGTGELTSGTIGTNHIYAILLEDNAAAGLAMVLLL